MTPIDAFARVWRLSPAGCSFFPAHHTLTITIPNAEITECNIAWREGSGQTWNITAIPLVEEGILAHDSIEVWSVHERTKRRVRLWLEDNNQTLKGHLESPLSSSGRHGDGPVGTFTAEAGSGEELVDATPLEERTVV